MRLLVVKIFSNLIQTSIPYEIFEESIDLATKDPSSQASQVYQKVSPQIRFEGAKFVQFMYNYLVSIRHKMWAGSFES